MISIQKYDKRRISKSFSSASTIALFFALAMLLSTAYLATGSTSNGLSSFAFATDKEFDIDVDIEKDSIKRGDTQDITVTVRNDDTGKGISDAEVRLTVYPPDSDSTSANDDTDDDGVAEFKVKIDDDAETGEYDVKIRVSKDGYDTKTVNTSFDVIKKHHHDDDDDDNGNGSASSASASASAGSSSAAAASAVSAASGSSAASAAAASPSAAAAAAAAAGGSSASSAASGGSSAVAVGVSD